MNEVLSELLRVLARDWKTLKDGMLDYHLMKAADMADELERELDEAQAGLDDIEEYGTEEINAAVDLRHQLAAALCERDEACRLVAIAQEAFNVIHVEVGGWISARIEGGDK